MEIARLDDYELIKKTMTHQAIYGWISDDGSPKREDFHPAEHESIFYLGCYDRGEYLGLFMCVPHAHAWYVFHTCLLPLAWGRSVLCAKLAVEWMFLNTPCQRMTTIVPENNRLALRLAKKVGAAEYGFNPSCWLKNSRLLGVYMLGVTKGGL